MVLNNEIAKQIAKINDKEIYNTFYLGSQISPSFLIKDGSLIIKTLEREVEINYIVECLLRTLAVFTFCPLWYFKNELKDIYAEEVGDIINNLIHVNIVFIENTTNGAFIRPTKNLFKMFNIPQKKMYLIPYNMLTHELSKFDIFYKITRGTCVEFNNYVERKNIESLIYKPNLITSVEDDNYSVVELLDGIGNIEDLNSVQNSKTSSLIIDESNIKIDKSNEAKITNVENQIIQELSKGETETFELKDFSGLFADNVHCKSGNIMIKYPDLIVPIKRNKDLSPNTIGIEMELTPKEQSHYDESILAYKNNLKYGAVIWFVTDFRTKARIYQTLKSIGGTGSCETIVANYNIPVEYIFR